MKLRHARAVFADPKCYLIDFQQDNVGIPQAPGPPLTGSAHRGIKRKDALCGYFSAESCLIARVVGQGPTLLAIRYLRPS